jgi:hypothetical protein
MKLLDKYNQTKEALLEYADSSSIDGTPKEARSLGISMYKLDLISIGVDIQKHLLTRAEKIIEASVENDAYDVKEWKEDCKLWDSMEKY